MHYRPYNYPCRFILYTVSYIIWAYGLLRCGRISKLRKLSILYMSFGLVNLFSRCTLGCISAVKWRLTLISDLGAVRDQNHYYKRFAVIEYVHDEGRFAYFARFNHNKTSSYICQLQQQGLLKLLNPPTWWLETIWLIYCNLYWLITYENKSHAIAGPPRDAQ